MNQLTVDKATVIIISLMTAFFIASLVFRLDESQLVGEKHFGRMFLPLSYHTPMPIAICNEKLMGRIIYRSCE